MTAPELASRWRRAAGVALRLAALAATAALLLATSPLPLCGEYTAPVTFQVSAGCGPGGVVVVEADAERGNLTIFNIGALSQRGAPGGGGGGGGGATGSFAGYGRYEGAACPFELAFGEWSVGQCRATLGEDDVLWFRCIDSAGGEVCRSQLTVEP